MYATRYMLPYQVATLNQGTWGTCYPNALVSSMESQLKMAGITIAPLSRLQSYYDTRESQGTLHYDSGSIGYHALGEAINKGIAPESMWGYTYDHMYSQPTQAVYDAAYKTRVAHYSSLYNNSTAEVLRDGVLQYLSQGKSVIAGFHIRQYFNDQRGPLAQQNSDGDGNRLGGHAVQIIGWDSSIDGGSYIVKNSWGTSWGDNGYGTINYKQMATDFISMEVVTGYKINNEYINFSFGPAEDRVSEQYATILGRAAEQDGMRWWIENDLNSVATRGVFANMLINSAEGQSIYGDKDNNQFIELVYSSVLGRSADSSGLAYWSSLLDVGYSRGDIFDSIIVDVRNGSSEAHEALENKINLAMYITISLRYNGGEDAAIKWELSQVTADDNTLEIIKIGIPNDWTVM